MTLGTISRNHAHRTIAGIPTSLALTGRADILAGFAAAIWNSDPESPDLITNQQNSVRNIPNARNDVIAASAPHALTARLSINIPDRRKQFFPIGATVQIADKGHLVAHIERSHIRM